LAQELCVRRQGKLPVEPLGIGHMNVTIPIYVRRWSSFGEDDRNTTRRRPKTATSGSTFRRGSITCFWKHSPKTLLGQTEFGGWVLWSSKLTAEGSGKAAETSRKFWPHLASVFPVYCAEDFSATLEQGKITLPDTVKMFFDSIGNYHLFITSFDRSEIRILSPQYLAA